MIKKLKLLLLAGLLISPLLLVPVKTSAATTVAITSPSSNSTISGGSFTVSGTATADRKITVSVNGTEVGTTTSNGSGSWSLVVSGQIAGVKTITAVASVHYAYVSNSADATISVLDTDTDQKVGANISSGINQSNLVVSPDGTQMVTAGGFGSADIRVWDLTDPAVPAISDNITAPLANNLGLEYVPDGSEFWAVSTDFGGNTTIRSYNASNPATTADITGYTGLAGITIQFNAAGNKAYVSDCGDSAVHVIDVATKAETSTIAGVGCGGLAVGPNDITYLVDSTNDRVKQVNLSAETAGAFITVGDAPGAVLFNSDGSRAYVTNSNSNNISVINTGTDTVIETIALTGGPKSGIFNADGSKAYIARSTTDQIIVADGDTFSELSNITVGDTPVGVKAGPSESATASVSFTLAATSSLAATGKNTYLYMVVAGLLIVGSTAYLRYRFLKR